MIRLNILYKINCNSFPEKDDIINAIKILQEELML